MFKVSHDFLNWTSFPSSIKLWADDMGWHPILATDEAGPFPLIKVTPGSHIKATVNFRSENAVAIPGPHPGNFIQWYLQRTANFRDPNSIAKEIRQQFAFGTYSWTPYEIEFDMLPDTPWLRAIFLGAGGTPEKPMSVWLDDLKIYMDDKLIYDNYFSATPRPLGIVPVFNVTERVVKVYQRVRPGIIKPK